MGGGGGGWAPTVRDDEVPGSGRGVAPWTDTGAPPGPRERNLSSASDTSADGDSGKQAPEGPSVLLSSAAAREPGELYAPLDSTGFEELWPQTRTWALGTRGHT